MKITVDITKIDFFNTTIQLFQRGSIKQQQDLIFFIKNNKDVDNLNDVLEKEIDYKEIKDFIYTDMSLKENKNLNKKDQTEIINEYKEKYFLEKSRYEKYIKDIIPDKTKYEKNINTFFDDILKKTNETITTEELINLLNDNTNQFRELFNKTIGTTGRKKFSLVKDNKEIISRAKRIYKTLDNLKRDDKYFKTDFHILLSKISKDIMDRFFEENKILNLTQNQKIEEVSEYIQKVAQSFNNIKLERKFGDEDIIEKIKNNNKNIDFNTFNTLQGKGDSAGKDFYYRSREVFKQNLDINDNQSEVRTRRNKVLNIREKLEISKNLDGNFKEEFRLFLLNLLKVSDVEVNSGSKSLFINQTDFSSYLFLLNKEKINSFLNLSLDSNGNNSDIIMLLLNLKNIDENNVLNVINSKPKEKIKSYENDIKNIQNDDEILKNTKNKKIENIQFKIDEINKVKTQYQKVISKYGEKINSYIESELKDIINYTIHLYKKDISNLIKLKPEKIKEELNNVDDVFLEVEEIESFFEIMSNIKSNLTKNNLIKEKLKNEFRKDKNILNILENIDDFKIKNLTKFDNKDINQVINLKNKINDTIEKYHKIFAKYENTSELNIFKN